MRMRERQNQIIADFSIYSTWEEKYRHLIDIGKKLEPLPEEFRKEDFKVKGCQSQVWLHARLNAKGEVLFCADSDALIVKGLVALLIKFYSEATPEEILSTPPDFLGQLELSSHLSPSRANGLFAMTKQIKFYAAAFKAMKS